jgi:predicted RNA binding protein YcfA (HicA-like mRNA interferase family)
MRRKDVIRHITELGAVFVREGGGHTVYKNPRTGMLLGVPRHGEVSQGVSRRLTRDAAL